MTAPSAELLAIGDELVHGNAVDTNSGFVARHLEALGIRVARCTVVSDDPADLDGAVTEACARADVVVTTGGLGPTEDDRTRHAVAHAAGVELRFDPKSWEWIEAWFRARGRKLRGDNRRQALVPVGGEPIENRWGTAPGLRMRVGGARLFALPGVPNEMRQMLEHAVLPELRVELAHHLRPIAHRTLNVLGPTEAALGARIADEMALLTGDVRVGVTAHYGLLRVRVAATGPTEHDAARAADAMAERLRPKLGDELVFEGEHTLAERVFEELRARGLTLATAESCTGGLCAKMLTDVPGSSAVFPGGLVTYSNASKARDLGVAPADLEAHGAVSEPVVRAMAEGVGRRFSSDVAVAITGIAGPDGGTPDKPVGTVWFGLCAGGTTVAWHRRIPPVSRAFVRERSAFEAFAAVLRFVRDGAFSPPAGAAPGPKNP